MTGYLSAPVRLHRSGSAIVSNLDSEKEREREFVDVEPEESPLRKSEQSGVEQLLAGRAVSPDFLLLFDCINDLAFSASSTHGCLN